MRIKISRHELLLIIGFYVFMALNYYVTLFLDLGVTTHYRAVLLNYGFKAVLSVPVALLVLKQMKNMSWSLVLLIHLATLIAFSFTWMKMYYAACDYLDIYRPRDSKFVWDFYLTSLFYAIQFGGLHLYLYNQEIKEANLLMSKINRLKSESELSALKSQLNPHFLYNVFNTISSAIPREAKPAREMINILADIFRYQLKASRQKMVLIQDELLYINRYLKLEKKRFGSRLAFRIETGGTLTGFKMPPTLLQPIVENAIKHGISPMVGGGEVIIKVQPKEAVVRFVISDTGVGAEDEELSDLLGTGIGLTNTNERLIKMYGQGLILSHNQPQGLHISFSVPLKD
ncbi:MAG: sensor histidine kinase [Lewinella sp.]